MAADFLRELGVLLVAFGPLDYVFTDRATTLTDRGIGVIVGIGLGFFLAGMLVERTRRQ